jgi:capsular exopolysaccharide synthesis family protein
MAMAKQTRSKYDKTRRDLITHSDKRSPISELYRTIRTNIEFTAVDEPVKTMVVTSPAPGEGKSTTAANLAVVFAQNGNKVLYVDGDLRKPTSHYTFGAMNTIGLTNVLVKKNPLETAVQKTKVENLFLLTSGPIPPNPAELLNSKEMEGMLEHAKALYDIIIIDSPPVMAVTDAQILANKCDGTILVLSSGKTDREQATTAKELLTKAKAKLLGVVLNNKKMKAGHNYYYYSK